MVLFYRSAMILLNLSVIYSDGKLLDINKEYSERIRFHGVISRYPTPFRPIPLNEPHLRGISALNVNKVTILTYVPVLAYRTIYYK